MRFEDQVVVVTGAAQGIGKAVAEAFAAEGAKVAVVDLQETQAKEVAAAIVDSGGTAIGIPCDVASRESVNAAAQSVRDEFGPIQVLISNAGITAPAMIRKMTDEQWRSVMAVHVDASFYWLQAVVEDMVELGKGNIVFSSSSTAQNGSIGQVNYAAAKSAILGIMRTAARELGRYGIRVNAVAPAAATPMTEKIRTDPKFAHLQGKSPVGRTAEAEEVAPVYLFLCSSEAGFVTGQVVSADGGGMMVR